MIWLTLRQQRTEIVILTAVFVVLGGMLLLSGLEMQAAYHNLGVGACVGSNPPANCFEVTRSFDTEFASLVSATGWLNFLPLLIGLLLGAPVILELEQRSFRLPWTQSITRTHWFLVKVGIIALLAIVASAVFGEFMTWWRLPLDHLDGSFGANEAFDFEGIVPMAYGLFAVSLGIAAGSIIRKTIPAAAVALAAYLPVRLFTLNVLRPQYMSPLRQITGFGPSNGGPSRGDWVLGSGWIRHGHQLSDAAMMRVCDHFKMSGGKSGMTTCLRAHHILGFTLYQPADRFWAFQGIEAAIFVGLSVALLGLAGWFVRFRVR